MRKLALFVLLFSVGVIAQTTPPEHSEKTVEGCLLREGPDLFLRPLSGNSQLIHLSAAKDQDLLKQVGKRVRVHGTDQRPQTAPNTSAAAQPVTPVEKQPAPSTLPSGTPDPNVPVTQLPQSAQAGEGTEGFRGNAPARELYVSSFEPLAGSCKPAAARKFR
jgi:hypothetical protein